MRKVQMNDQPPNIKQTRKLLQAYFYAQFMHTLGRIPAGCNSIFNVDYQDVKDLPFEEAKQKIIEAANKEIANFQAIRQEQEIAKQTVRHGECSQQHKMGKAAILDASVLPYGIRLRKTYPNIPMAAPNGQPPLPFPKRPQSHEASALFDYFCYQLLTYGLNCMTYQATLMKTFGRLLLSLLKTCAQLMTN